MTKTNKVPGFETVDGFDNFKVHKSDTISPELIEFMPRFYKSFPATGLSEYAANFALDGEAMMMTGQFDEKGKPEYKTQWRLISKHWHCHNPWTGAFNWSTTKGMINLHTRLRRPETQVRFLDYILDPQRSPWAKGLANCTVVYDEVWHNKTNFRAPVALVQRCAPEMNLHIFTNLLIATRLVMGWGIDWFWEKFLELGFNEEEALIFAVLFSWNGQTITNGRFGDERTLTKNPVKAGVPITMTGSVSGDQPLGLKMSKQFSTSRFLEKDPEDAESSYKSGGKMANPCNWIWSNNKLSVTDTSLELYTQFAKQNIGFRVGRKAQSNFLLDTWSAGWATMDDIYGLKQFLVYGKPPGDTTMELLRKALQTDSVIFLHKCPDGCSFNLDWGTAH